jgi:hypothetical protein
MKVICIDASDGYFSLASKLLKEGETYTVIGEPLNGLGTGYLLAEAKLPNHPISGFMKDRFIPLSNINERELELVDDDDIENDNWLKQLETIGLTPKEKDYDN